MRSTLLFITAITLENVRAKCPFATNKDNLRGFVGLIKITDSPRINAI